MLRTILLIILGLLLAAAIFTLLTLLRRIRRQSKASAPVQPLIDNPPPMPEISLDEAVENLRVRRDRSSVLDVREALRRIAGASESETLGDLLQHAPANDGTLRRMLIAIERAAFIHDAQLQRAIDGALSAGEQSTTR